MDNNDLFFAIGKIDDELIEASEQKPKRNFKAKSLVFVNFCLGNSKF